MVYSTGSSGNSFSWTASGAASVSGENSSEFIVNWETTCGSGYVAVTETIITSGCSASVNLDVDRVDTQAPSITTPASPASSECQGTIPNNNTDYIAWLQLHGGAIASDECDNNLTWTDNTGTAVWGGTACARTITITFTVTDDCGTSRQPQPRSPSMTPRPPRLLYLQI